MMARHDLTHLVDEAVEALVTVRASFGDHRCGFSDINGLVPLCPNAGLDQAAYDKLAMDADDVLKEAQRLSAAILEAHRLLAALGVEARAALDTLKAKVR
ncbi:hypothetical protein [Novosphingobium sp. EMRT-2]|uniref:hypothetical protein n=1 Tax=Novosphingobium sp. EMRT-2 TaxID=2571749 RepID=UPI0010BD6165|nr:hypothetical protein [Novosphingobium sp. EMRT-2]QCI92579.1 hypothetical protein FA702_02760 [Novosphingobium sp. EMRT-2]